MPRAAKTLPSAAGTRLPAQPLPNLPSHKAAPQQLPRPSRETPAAPAPGTHWARGSGRRCIPGWSPRCPGWPPWAEARAGTPAQGACRPPRGPPPPPRRQRRRLLTAPGRSLCSGGWPRPPAPRPRCPPLRTSWTCCPQRSLGHSFTCPLLSMQEAAAPTRGTAFPHSCTRSQRRACPQRAHTTHARCNSQLRTDQTQA